MINLFKKEEAPKNLEEVVKTFEKLEKKVDSLEREIERMKEESFFYVNKVGLVRYNALPKLGGNQSFSLALLDKRNCGFVITSLYLEEKNRVYIKPMKEGKTDYTLSEEEKEAIRKAG